MVQVTGTHFNYFFICPCKLWLFAHGIHMEHTSDLVYEGRLIHETRYPQRSKRYKEVAVEGIKIDYFDINNRIIHEVKKSDKMEKAHEWQVKYYMYVLKQHGVNVEKSILEYPVLHRKSDVYLSSLDEQQIKEYVYEISEIIVSDRCPLKIKSRSCNKCSYFDFCWSGEE